MELRWRIATAAPITILICALTLAAADSELGAPVSSFVEYGDVIDQRVHSHEWTDSRREYSAQSMQPVHRRGGLTQLSKEEVSWMTADQQDTVLTELAVEKQHLKAMLRAERAEAADERHIAEEKQRLTDMLQVRRSPTAQHDWEKDADMLQVRRSHTEQHQWENDSSPGEVEQILTDFGEEESSSDVDGDLSQLPSLTAEEEAEEKRDRERRAYIEVEEAEFANEMAESYQERVMEQANKRQRQKEKEKREIKYAGLSEVEAMHQRRMVKNMARKTAEEVVSRAAKDMARDAIKRVANAVHHEVVSDVQHELPRQLPDELLRVDNSWRLQKPRKYSSVQHLARAAADEVQHKDDYARNRVEEEHVKPLNKDIVPIQHVSKEDHSRDHPVTHHISSGTPGDTSRHDDSAHRVSDLTKTSKAVSEEINHEDGTQQKDAKVKKMMAQIAKLQATLKANPKSSSSDTKNGETADHTDEAKADIISPHTRPEDLIMESDHKKVEKTNPTPKSEDSAAVKSSQVMPPLPKTVEDMPPIHQKLVTPKKVQEKPVEEQPEAEGDTNDEDPEGEAEGGETEGISSSSELTLLTYGLWIFVGALVVGLLSTIIYCACQGPRDRPWGMPRKRQY